MLYTDMFRNHSREIFSRFFNSRRRLGNCAILVLALKIPKESCFFF
jgi:hypothetical protein